MPISVNNSPTEPRVKFDSLPNVAVQSGKTCMRYQSVNVFEFHDKMLIPVKTATMLTRSRFCHEWNIFAFVILLPIIFIHFSIYHLPKA